MFAKAFALIFAFTALSEATQDDRGTRPPTNDADFNIQHDAMNIADIQNMTEINMAKIEKLYVRFSANVTSLKNQLLATQKSVAMKAKEVEHLALQEDLKLSQKLTQYMNILKQALENQMMAKSTVVVKIFDQKLITLKDLIVRLKMEVETLKLNVKQAKEENKILSSQVQLQKGELQKEFAKKTDALNKTIKHLQKENDDLKAALTSKTVLLESKVNQTTKSLKAYMNKLQSDVSTQVRDTKLQFVTLKDSMEYSVGRLERATKQLVTYVSAPRWPGGRYCFLSNGPCPSGFQKSDGYMSSVRHSIRVRQGKFGDSYIRCTGGRCRSYTNYSDLYLSVCCK